MLEVLGLDDLNRDELVPVASILLLIGAVIVSGFDYALIKQGSTLVFYAVIIQIWTDFDSVDLTTSHIEFLLVSVGAVLAGHFIEQVVVFLSGDMLAVQSLALAILISRIYVNSHGGEWLRWDDLVDRYVVYIPCTIALLLPIVLYHVDFNPVFGVDPNSLLSPSRDTFSTLAYLSIFGSILLYGRVEKGWSLSS